MLELQIRIGSMEEVIEKKFNGVISQMRVEIGSQICEEVRGLREEVGSQIREQMQNFMMMFTRENQVRILPNFPPPRERHCPIILGEI